MCVCFNVRLQNDNLMKCSCSFLSTWSNEIIQWGLTVCSFHRYCNVNATSSYSLKNIGLAWKISRFSLWISKWSIKISNIWLFCRITEFRKLLPDFIYKFTLENPIFPVYEWVEDIEHVQYTCSNSKLRMTNAIDFSFHFQSNVLCNEISHWHVFFDKCSISHSE